MKVGEYQNTFGLIIHSTADGTRPVTAMGASVTPAQNAYGSYAQLIAGASLTDDCYELEINVNTVGISTTARDAVVSIGLDPAGGTSYTSIVDLVAGQPGGYVGSTGGGATWRIPIRIAAGTSIAAAAAVNSATLTAINVHVRAYCKPSAPERLFAGSYIDQFGVTLASSAGTAITEGTTSEGAWTAISSTLTRPLHYLTFGYGQNQATLSGFVSIDIGVGDASNKNVVISNAWVVCSTTEQTTKPPWGANCRAAIGDILYARAQSSAAANSGATVAIYGVGA